MSIRPLDLQTLFVKMASVGKDQALIQKSVENQQSREANQLVKEENKRDSAVNKVEEDKASDSIKDNNENSGEQKNMSQKDRDDKDSDDKPKYYTDPKRGHNLDISG